MDERGIDMVSKKIVINSALGIHLRPAGAMCDAAIKFDSHIGFNYGPGKNANAKSVISILAAGVKCGDEIELTAEGDDEKEALEAVTKAFLASLKD
jgi:phosphocarrier protein